MSHDHKPELPSEKARIENSGGRVEPMRDGRNDPIGPPRVWVAREMYPGLAMSRSIGDSIAQSVGVSCEPEVRQAKFKKKNQDTHALVFFLFLLLLLMMLGFIMSYAFAIHSLLSTSLISPRINA
jgi:hypothetical protein